MSTETADPTPKVTRLDLDQLQPDLQNANTGTDEGERLLNQSLAELGAGRSILLDKNNTIIAGNKTAGQADQVGIRKVIIVDTDGTELVAVRRTDLDLSTDPRATRLALADNRVAQLDLAWDQDILSILAQNQPEALEGLWSEQEIHALLAEQPEEQPAPRDAGPDPKEGLQAKYETASGQIWSLGPHRLLIGDSTSEDNLQRLMGTELAAMTFTDPPYGVSYESEAQGSIANDQHTQDDLVRFLRPCLANAVRWTQDTGAFYIWHATRTRKDFEWAMTAVGLEERQYITWVKDGFTLGREDYHWQIEPCFYAQKAGQRAAWYGDRTQSTVWRASTQTANETAITLGSWLHLSTGAGEDIYIRNKAPKNQRARHIRLADGESALLITAEKATDAWQVSRDPAAEYIHSTQKPVALATRALANSTRPGELVLDLFFGSGSTLIAAERSGRRAYGLELSPLFAAAILERYVQETGTLPERTT